MAGLDKSRLPAGGKSDNRGWPLRLALLGQSSLLALGAVLISAYSGPAVAQDSEYVGDVTIDELIVTARKREERLIDTPLAVSAISGEQLRDRNLKDLSDVGKLVPNMAFDRGSGGTGGSGNAQIFIRGVGQQDFLFTADPGVGLYIDGVYFPRGTGIVMDIVDLERVEVLRGPQGTLFGKNTIGGAVNITTNKPTNEFGAFAEVSTGSRHRFDANGMLNVPLVEDLLALRVSGSFRRQDGYVDRVNAGDTLGDIDSLFGRAQLRWTPTPSLTIDVATDLTRKRETSIAEELLDYGAGDPSNVLLALYNGLVAPSLGAGVQIDNRFLSSDFETQGTGANFSNFDMFGTSLTVDWSVTDQLSVKSITSYREQDSQFAADNDHSPFQFIESNNNNRHDAISQELQFIGSGFDGRLDFVIGGFFMKENGEDLYDTYYLSGLYDALELLPAAVIPLASGVTCPSLFCAGGAGNPLNASLDLDVLIATDIEIDSYAAFGEANFDLTDALTLTAGLRYSYDKKTFTTSPWRKTAGVAAFPTTTQENSWDNVTPKVSLSYSINENATTYFSATSGFKSGGFNGRALSLAELTTYDPEKVWSYEIGGKFVTPSKRYGLNAAVFYSDYSDMQLLSVRNVGGIIAVVTENAGAVTMKGAEVEIFATPLPGFRIQSGIGYLDAEYSELDASATITKNEMLVKAPKWTVNAAADYTFDLAESGSITLGGDVSYRSEFANDLANTPLLVQDGYATLGAFLRYAPESKEWSVTTFGTNLTDKRYITNGISSYGSFGNAVANFGSPREWGLRLHVDF